MIDTQTRILRQVLLKIASEKCQAEPKVLVEYAKQLEAECKDWL